MAKVPAWKRHMTPEQRLEFEIQNTYRTIMRFSRMRGVINETWRYKMLRHFANKLRFALETMCSDVKSDYKITNPIWYDINGFRLASIEKRYQEGNK